MTEAHRGDLSIVIPAAQRADKPAPFSHTGTEMAVALAEDIEVFVPDNRTWQERHYGYNGVQVIADRNNGWRTFQESVSGK
jgi:hypothetical protein